MVLAQTPLSRHGRGNFVVPVVQVMKKNSRLRSYEHCVSTRFRRAFDRALEGSPPVSATSHSATHYLLSFSK